MTANGSDEESSQSSSRSSGTPTMEDEDQIDLLRGPSPQERNNDSFIRHFCVSKGPPQIVFLCLLLAMALGSTIGVVPVVVTDRYARLAHGYTDPRDCSYYHNIENKPTACQQGSNDAQEAAAISNFVSNILTFFTSSLVGSISDEKGRKGTTCGVGLGRRVHI